jgi:hypothetical protein
VVCKSEILVTLEQEYFTYCNSMPVKSVLKIEENTHEGANLKGAVSRKIWPDEGMGR